MLYGKNLKGLYSSSSNFIMPRIKRHQHKKLPKYKSGYLQKYCSIIVSNLLSVKHCKGNETQPSKCWRTIILNLIYTQPRHVQVQKWKRTFQTRCWQVPTHILSEKVTSGNTPESWKINPKQKKTDTRAKKAKNLSRNAIK